MARRIGALRLSAPPASLALAVSILTPLLLLWAPATVASAKRADKAAAPEGLTAPAPGGEAEQHSAAVTEAPPAGAGKGTRKARKRAAEAGSPGVEPAAGSSAGGGEGHGAGAKGSSGLQPVRKNAQRRAERLAESTQRRAERLAGKAAERDARRSESPARADAPGAQPLVHGKARKEREREQRRKQREARGEKQLRHETRKEREAREAGGSGAAGAGSSTTATPAAATAAAAPAPAASAPSASVTPAGKRGATRAGAPRRQARHVRRASRSRSALAGTILGTPPLSAPSSAAPQAARHPASRPAKHSVAPKSSQLVTTVTRIIGVIPATLWLLMGALGLLALLFAVSSRLSARRAGRLARQREQLLADVGLLQAALLPELPGRLGPVGTTAAYHPASGPAAGGDFYDVFALENGRLAVIVGDVSGHGREALPHTTLVRFTLRAYLEAGLSPRETLRAAAPVLERQLGGSFATVVIATYDPRERELTYSCAGHPHPLLAGLPQDAAIIACSAPPIGAGRRTGTRQTVVSLPGATVACFYTDGVIEARLDGELFGSARLAEALTSLGPEPTAAALLDRVAQLTDRRPDDMAACLLGVAGEQAAPRIEVEELELDEQELGRPRPRRFLAAAGIADAEADAILDQARTAVASHGSALLQVRPGDGCPTATVTNNNLAPLRVRAIARSQEVAL